MTRRALGLVLALLGGAVAVTCIALALRELGGLYAGATNDPLGQPETAEADVSRRMLNYAAIGAAGVVPMAIGVALVRGSFLGKRFGADRPNSPPPLP
jgi:hypothetical protein